MEHSPSKLVDELSALMAGLAAALVAIRDDESATESVRRIARSLRGRAQSVGAADIADLAQAVIDAPTPEVEPLGQAVLERWAEVRTSAVTRPSEVLVIEDNPTVAAALLAYLDRPDLVTHHAENAQQAEAILSRGRVDLVVLDLILPDRDGRDLLVQMRERPETAATPVVVLSGETGVTARAESIALGADEFLTKPARPDSLRESVTRALARARALREASTDALTGLPDRGAVAKRYTRMDRASQARSTPLSVAIIQLDDLPRLNESVGREAGDHFIRTTARVLSESTVDDEALGRWAGDKFVALLPGSDIRATAQRLEAALARLRDEETFDDIGRPYSFSAGVGPAIASAPLNQALAGAEAALRRMGGRGARSVVATTEHTDSDPEDGAAPDPAQLRVLLVEDDRTTATLIIHRLKREGYEVTHCADGGEALEHARVAEFELAILDVKIPGIDGFALLERLRELPHVRSTPVLMLTGMTSEADVVRGLALGADDYMLKPFSPTELIARVQRLSSVDGR